MARTAAWLLLLSAFVALSSPAQQNFESVEVQTVPVAEGLPMSIGRGGNIAVVSGPDGDAIVWFRGRDTVHMGDIYFGRSVRERAAAVVAAGRSVDEFAASQPTAEFDAVWGSGFLTPEIFQRILYADLARSE